MKKNEVLNMVIVNIVINFIFFIASNFLLMYNFNNQTIMIANQEKSIILRQQSLRNDNRLLQSESNLNEKLNKVNNKVDTVSKQKSKVIVVPINHVIVKHHVVIKLVKPVLPAVYKTPSSCVHALFGHCK